MISSIHLLKLFHFTSSVAAGWKTLPAPTNTPTQHSSQISWLQVSSLQTCPVLGLPTLYDALGACPLSSLHSQLWADQNIDCSWYWFNSIMYRAVIIGRKGNKRWRLFQPAWKDSTEFMSGWRKPKLGWSKEKGEGCELGWWSCRPGWHILSSYCSAWITPRNSCIPAALLPWVEVMGGRGSAPLLPLCNSITARTGESQTWGPLPIHSELSFLWAFCTSCVHDVPLRELKHDRHSGFCSYSHHWAQAFFSMLCSPRGCGLINRWSSLKEK